MSTPLASHLIAAPVLLPLLTAGVMLLLGEQRRGAKSVLGLLSVLGGLAVAVTLLVHVAGATSDATAFAAYLPGNWPVPFGIVLVVDGLSALMLVLSSCIGLAVSIYALARWHRAGVYFHVLLQLQLMGLNGAFLTADLFNLFVFFEVLLAASYGLLLHGGGGARVRAGLHYIAINLLASLLFLIGVAVLYGVTGTLNMADIAAKLRLVADGDLGLLHAGAAILGLAFLTKAAIWPLGFWLPAAYGAASAPAAALFALLTKVGVYALLRLWTLCFPATAGESAHFGGAVLVWGGIVTLAFGSVGMLAAQHLGRIAAFSVMASSGTLVAAIGFADVDVRAGALYYLVGSTLAACALFLLVELMDRAREVIDEPDVDDGGAALPMFIDAEPPESTNLDENEEALVGRAFPAALAFLGLAFIVAVLVLSGLPPLNGFIGKLGMLMALTAGEGTGVAGWTLFALLILSGLMAATAFVRAGMRLFWTAQERAPSRVALVEGVPVGLLLLACLSLAVLAEPALRFARATAVSLDNPGGYIGAVMNLRAVSADTAASSPSPTVQFTPPPTVQPALAPRTVP